MNRLIIILFALLCCLAAIAQSPVADFTLPVSVCKDQNIEITNSASNAESYEWDFCLDDFLTLKSSANVTNLPGLSGGYGYKLIQTNGLWYGFAIGRDNNGLYRLNYGTNPENIPTVTALGNPNSKLLLPEGIDIIQSDGNWYGFVGSLEFSTAGQGIIRLDFGTSLTNVPVATNLGNFGITTRFRNLTVVQQGTDLILFLVNYNGSSLIRINYGNSFNNTIGASNITELPIAGASLPTGIDIIKKGTTWITHITSLSNSRILQLNFGTDILSTPVVEGDYGFSGINRPCQIQTVLEGDKYFGIVSNENQAIQIIDFKDLIPASTPTAVTISGLPTLLGIDAIRLKGKGIVQGVSILNNGVRQVVFEANCSATFSFSTDQNPVGLRYSTSGVKRIEQSAIKSSTSERSMLTKSVTISSASSPDISFTTDGKICAASPIAFTSANTSGDIISYAWDFGDSNSGSGSSTSHQFAAGTYTVRLSVTSLSACENFYQLPVTVYNAPAAAFNLPVNNPLCTNQTVTFTNTTTFDSGLTPTWQWSVDGTPVSTAKDLSRLFSSASSPSIKLAAIIPGCTNEVTQSLTSLLAGPVISFTLPTSTCQNSLLEFTNTTTDPVTSFLWNYGDSQTSAGVNGSHSYGSIGPFSISLQGSSANGCQNSLTKSITIRSIPSPNFSLSLPPFSCSGASSQFNDTSPNPSDSFLSSWSWNFGDPGSVDNTSSVRNPQHIYANAGPYKVSLTAETNFGCQASFEKTVTIAKSPVADFTNTPACKDKAVNFSDASDSQSQSWFWQIESTTYFYSNPTHIFTAPGNYPVELTVVGSNNCISYVGKTVHVPAPVVPDFSVQKNCNLQNTLFTDLTTSVADPVVNRAWEFGSLGTGTGSPATFSFPTTGSVSVKLKTTMQSGCDYSTTKSVTIVAAPVASFTASPEQGIPPLNVNFTNTSTNATSYLWTFHDKNNSTSTATSPSFTFEEYGDNAVDLTASNALGCTHTVSKIIKTILPVKDIAVTAVTVVKNEDGSLKVLAALKNNGNSAVGNFLITLDLSGFTSVREKVIGPIAANALTNHVFTYEITDATRLDFLCAEVELDDDFNTGNDKKCASLKEQLVTFEPYPNPANDVVNIYMVSNEALPVMITLLDAMGKEAFRAQVQAEAGDNTFELHTDKINNGIYLLILDTGKYRKIRSIVISH